MKQPEIHLNPRQQCILAEFLVEASSGRRLVVETHSEHILLTIRRMVAERRIDASDVALYFVERKDGCSHARAITIGPKGQIAQSEWPEGFFGDTLKESLALAAAQARRDSDHALPPEELAGE